MMVGPMWNGQRARLAGQISPGPLARAHKELEGALNCTKCHAGRKDDMSDNCQSCHRDIRWVAQQDRGLHGSREIRAATCASCHPDHAGENFQLVKWPDGSQEHFDHRRTGWPLEKTHARKECKDCHTAKFQVSPAARVTPRKRGGGFAGLETDCASCHEDIHRGQLSADCGRCHDAGKWTLTPGFRHDSTGFALTNKHTEVKCDKCHLTARLATRTDGAGRRIPVYRPVPHQNCSDCHTDPHTGRLGPACADCHTTAGFHTIDRQRFDHSRTKFALKGKHAVVRCVECHRDFSTAQLKKPAFETCGVCHQDAHGGSATLAGRKVDCDACHSVAGFTPGTFTVEQHRNTKYPLEGKHQAVACGTCHRKETSATLPPHALWGTSRVVIRPASARCLDCHQDDHGGQLTARPDKGDCGACHEVKGWTPSRFDQAQHAKTRLPIGQRHLEIACRACHGEDRKGLPALAKTVTVGKAGFLFHVVETDCAACHTDPHRGRFTARGARAKAAGCAACHDARAFRPSTADVATHQSFGFPLDGAHRATPCMACHAEMKTVPPRRSSLVAAGTVFPALAFTAKTACGDCHETPHGTQFASRKDAGKCDACHGTDDFAPAARFDHNRDASFSLKGAHERVPCSECHPVDTSSRDPRRLVFRPVSGKCESCHAEKETR
jgi:hypothetical protein